MTGGPACAWCSFLEQVVDGSCWALWGHIPVWSEAVGSPACGIPEHSTGQAPPAQVLRSA